MHSFCNTVDNKMLKCIALVLSDDYLLSHLPLICHVFVCVDSQLSGLW